MTEIICYSDCYCGSCSARVAKVTGRGIILERPIFHSEGGGQLCDNGRVGWGEN